MLLKQAHALSMRSAFLRRCEGADLLQSLPVGIELQAGPISCPVSIEPGDKGCYSCTYTGREAGSYRLLVTCKGKPIGGSPFSVMVQHTSLQSGHMLRSMWLTVASASHERLVFILGNTVCRRQYWHHNARALSCCLRGSLRDNLHAGDRLRPCTAERHWRRCRHHHQG